MQNLLALKQSTSYGKIEKDAVGYIVFCQIYD